MKKIASLLILLATMGLTGCAATVIGAGAATGAAVAADDRGAGNVVSDQNLERKVNNVLSAQVPSGSFTVASYRNEVLLAGQVPTAADKDKAFLAAKNTAGVKNVFDYITIRKNETFSQISNDTYLTSLAKSRLITQKKVNANNIKVVTCEKVVYLLGSNAGDSVQVNGAISGIRQIDGVKDVVNLIQSYK